MTLNVKTLGDAISNSDNWYWDEVSYYVGRCENILVVDGDEYPVEVVEEYTGSEGDYSAVTFIVFKVGDKVFKKTGHYQSHYGNDWDGPLVEVVEIEKTVKVWDEVKPMEFTAGEVAEAVLETGDGWSEMGWGDTELTIRGEKVTAKAVEYKGGEDQGSYTCVVFEIDGRLFRKEGYYASHYGTDWDGDFSEVEVYEKTVKDYREV